MRSPSQAIALVASALLALGLAGCADSSTDDGASGASPTPAASAPPNTSASPNQDVTVVTTAATELGTILVDGKGMTLYMFSKDTQDYGVSTCDAECLAAWPPVTGTPQAGAGIDAAKLGVLERTTGLPQVSYNGWPLYYWAEDLKPGETAGQGNDGVWWVLGADGEPIKTRG